MIRKKRTANNIVGICLLILLALNLLACGNSRYLIYRQKTVIGVDAGLNPNTKNFHGVLGFDREVDALVPKQAKGNESGYVTDGQDAMSVIAKSYTDVGFFEVNEISECFATGDAAVNIAKSQEKMKAMSRCRH